MKKNFTKLFMTTAAAAMLAAGITAVPVLADDDLYEIYMNFPTFGTTPEGIYDVEDYINDCLKDDEVDAKVVFQPVSVFNLANENNLTISAGDKLDLILTMWAGGLSDYINKNAIIELDDIYEEYGKELAEVQGTSAMGGYYDGKLYGITYSDNTGVNSAYHMRKDLLEEYIADTGFEYDRDKIYTIDDLENILEWCHNKYPDMHLFAGTGAGIDLFQWFYGVDDLGSSVNTGMLFLDGSKDTTVQNLYATEEYKEYAHRMKEWADKGYFSANDSTNEDAASVQIPTGNYAGWINQCYPTDFKASDYGYDLCPIQLYSRCITTGKLSDTAWAITINSEQPEKVMQFLNAFYTDERISTAWRWGLEGVTYEVKGELADGHKTVDFLDGLDSSNAPYYNPFSLGNVDLVAADVNTEGQEYFDKLNQMREDAKTATEENVATLGYRFNNSSVSTEMAAISSVTSRYVGLISYGMTDDPDETIKEMNEELEAAGMSKVLEENQKQLDEWLAQQN